tara:strand:+ start:1175 stop:1636 length:462 start_codon:yes stop_codon:yes gene_type:complete
MTYIEEMKDLYKLVPQEYNRRYYVNGKWVDSQSFQMQGGVLKGKTKVVHIIFSSKFLKRYHLSRWGIFSLSAYQSGDVVIINDFYEIDSTQFNPSIRTITDIFHSNPYVNDLNPEDIYFFSDIETHNELLERLMELLQENSSHRPLSDYNIWI